MFTQLSNTLRTNVAKVVFRPVEGAWPRQWWLKRNCLSLFKLTTVESCQRRLKPAHNLTETTASN